jgi:hypothetical protein
LYPRLLSALIFTSIKAGWTWSYIPFNCLHYLNKISPRIRLPIMELWCFPIPFWWRQAGPEASTKNNSSWSILQEGLGTYRASKSVTKTRWTLQIAL